MPAEQHHDGSPMPRVSVVMTTYQAELHLEEALRSILAQTLRDFELIVVDDRSTDRTPQILGEFQLADPRVRPVTLDRAGRGASLNHGVRLARAPYVAILDADDVALPHRLATEA